MLHWQHIKGFYGSSSNLDDLLYTYINFQSKQDSDLTKEVHHPTITLVNGNNTVPLGYIVCSGVENTLLDFLGFANGKGIKWNAEGLPNNYSNKYKLYTSGYNLLLDLADGGKSGTVNYSSFSINQTYRKSGAGVLLELAYINTNQTRFRAGEFVIDAWTNNAHAEYNRRCFEVKTKDIMNEFSSRSGYIGSFTVYSSDGTNTTKYLHIGSANDDNYKYSFGAEAFKSKKPIYGQFFNATSDVRAKEDIIPFTDSALDLVKKVQIYSFKYKDSKTKTMGILAQDLLSKEFDSLNLVDNINATGENDDYMTIKESKLVYVLWKAVQELSNEVENLKKELNK